MREGRDIIAIGASAGGVEAITGLLARLPGDLSASILVVLHRPAERISHLRKVLSRECNFQVAIPHEGDSLQHGVCYIGEPDRHLTVGPDSRLHLVADGFYRSHNIDALFWSLARYAGPRTIGVILSGLLKDGSLGLKAIKEAGGVALVQSPGEAAFPDMPQSAIKHDGPIDLVAPVHLLASEICRLSGYQLQRATVPAG